MKNHIAGAGKKVGDCDASPPMPKRRAGPRVRVKKKYPGAMLCLASMGYDIRSVTMEELGWGSTPIAAWADAARRLNV